MKTLLLMRHSKSDWSTPGVSDHDRPLNARGRLAAPRMGEVLLEHQLRPDLIVCSTAERARETATLLAPACGYAGDVLYAGEIYHEGPRRWLELLRALPGEHGVVLLVGHNPGMQELLTMLTGEEVAFSTAAIAHVKCDIDAWSALGLGELRDFWRPKELDSSAP